MPNSHYVNHLANEPSPYLQQHVHNPVDWYPWNQGTLAKAVAENKPILLSIGYAACHWCHVMAHESFEDEATAALMNQLFINIKVDKEERPDLDKVYQTAHYYLNRGAGGWPLTIFLTPDLMPFFSGTYFPKEDYQNMPSFKKILQWVATLYHNHLPDIKQQNHQLKQILQLQSHSTHEKVITAKPLQLALNVLEKNHDMVNGGFDGAPKFPQASKIRYLLENKSPLAINTIINMAKGGIYDQLAGGFYRYAVDERWNIPHFEKMLYDNGQLLGIYAQACQQVDEPNFKTIISQTAQWIMEQMQSPEGGFYSSLDADSEGEEGKYYSWDRETVRSLLTAAEYHVISPYYGLDKEPNFEGLWHFYEAESLKTISQTLTTPLAKVEELVNSAKNKLLLARNQRIRPFRDEKILTSWNGLAIKGLLQAGSCLKDEQLMAHAQQALHFIQQNHWHKHSLLASSKAGKAYLSAYLDDYVFLLDALLTSLQISWETKSLLFAIEITEVILKSFQDKEHGGFFFTADNHEKLLYRPKIMMDDALPAANGVLVETLLILGHFLGEPRYLIAAEKTLQAAWTILNQYPSEHCSLLLGLERYLNPPQLIIIRGDKNEMRQWQEIAQKTDNFTFAIPNDAKDLPKALAGKKVEGKCCAYVCRGTHCEAVVNNMEQLKAIRSPFL